MKNSIFLERASKLQKEFAELYKDGGFVAMDARRIHISDRKFHELEKEGLLEHISKDRTEDNYWRYEAMTSQGIKIIALECLHKMEHKKD